MSKAKNNEVRIQLEGMIETVEELKKRLNNYFAPQTIKWKDYPEARKRWSKNSDQASNRQRSYGRMMV